MKKIIEINNISVADCNLIDFFITKEKNEINIILEESYRISDSVWFGETTIKIKKWKKLKSSIFLQEEPFGKGEIIQFDYTKKLKKIHQIISEFEITNQSELKLGGTMKNERGWLNYIFNDFEYEIKAKEIN